MHLADVAGVVAVAAACPEAARWSRADYQRACLGEFDGWVAAVGGEVVGFLVARRPGEEMEILNLAVAPAFRRRGVATRFLEASLALGRASGARRVFLEVRPSNHGAISFYAARGFIPTGRRPRYYSDPVEDALIFSRELP
jgi:ribosomal-protein-alanine N-acetyltransferase